jgi:hypothetical protein
MSTTFLTLYLFSTSSTWSSGAGTSHDVGEESGGNTPVGRTLGQQSTAGGLLNALLRAYAHKAKEYADYAWFVDEDFDQARFKKERLAMIRSIWVLFGRELIYNAAESESRFVGFFAAATSGDKEMKRWQKDMIESGCWYVSTAGQQSDEEFEEIVRKERVLTAMYTTSEISP